MQSFDVISYPRAFRCFIFYIFIALLFFTVELRLAHGQAQKPDTPYVAELKKQLGGGSGGLSSFDITFIQNTAKAFLADPDKQKDFKTYLGSGAAAFEKKYGAGMLDYVNSIKRKDQLETLTKNQIERISDPVKAAKLAEEVSLGGASLPAFVEKHITMINPVSVLAPLLPGLYPPARNGFNTYQCQESGWPSKYWCDGCVARIPFGPCIAWGITPADTTRLFTEKLTVARGNDSAPYTLGLVRNLANNLQSAISAVPIVSSLKVLLNTVDFRQYCMNAMLMSTGLRVATGIAAGAGINVNANDIGQSLLACITKPNLSLNGMPKPSGINLLGLTSKKDGDYFKAALDGKITMAEADRIERALTTAAIGRMPGAINYNMGLTPAVVSRLLAKTLQDNKATYPNFRFIVSITGQVGFRIVKDPLIPFNILPPTREPTVPTAAEFINPRSSNAQFAENNLNDSRVMLASSGTSMTDYGLLPSGNGNNYFATASRGANASQHFSFAKDIFDGNLNMFIRGMPFDLALARSPTVIGFNKILAGNNFIPFLEQFKNPDLCTNPALALAFQKSNSFNNSEISKSIRYIQQLDRALMLLKFNGGTSRTASAVVSDIKKTLTTASNLTSGNIGQVQSTMCTAVTKTSRYTLLGGAKSNSEMGAVAKATEKDAQDITLFKEATTVLSRPREGFRFRFPYPVKINPRIYEQKYSAPSFKDKVQPSKAHLEALAPYAGGMQFNIAEQCRAPDISDEAAKDEKMLVVGAGANELNRWTAFASCPAYSPTNPNSIVGFLLRNFVFKIIPFPGGHLGVERFDIREY